MRFLIDNNLSPPLAEHLKAAGHEAAHVRDYGLQAAADPVVLARARGDDRVLEAYAELGHIRASPQVSGTWPGVLHNAPDIGRYRLRDAAGREKAERPSILLIRRLAGRRAAEQAAIILADLDVVTGDLEGGSVVVLTDDWVRVRRLPIGS